MLPLSLSLYTHFFWFVALSLYPCLYPSLYPSLSHTLNPSPLSNLWISHGPISSFHHLWSSSPSWHPPTDCHHLWCLKETELPSSTVTPTHKLPPSPILKGNRAFELHRDTHRLPPLRGCSSPLYVLVYPETNKHISSEPESRSYRYSLLSNHSLIYKPWMAREP